MNVYLKRNKLHIPQKVDYQLGGHLDELLYYICFINDVMVVVDLVLL
jgi:hypothetical protein